MSGKSVTPGARRGKRRPPTWGVAFCVRLHQMNLDEELAMRILGLRRARLGLSAFLSSRLPLVLLALAVHSCSSSRHTEPAPASCAGGTDVTRVPINDLGASCYRELRGGLYPEGSNA